MVEALFYYLCFVQIWLMAHLLYIISTGYASMAWFHHRGVPGYLLVTRRVFFGVVNLTPMLVRKKK